MKNITENKEEREEVKESPCEEEKKFIINDREVQRQYVFGDRNFTEYGLYHEEEYIKV